MSRPLRLEDTDLALDGAFLVRIPGRREPDGPLVELGREGLQPPPMAGELRVLAFVYSGPSIRPVSPRLASGGLPASPGDGENDPVGSQVPRGAKSRAFKLDPKLAKALSAMEL